MGLVSGYGNDVFISYSHIDNQPLTSVGGWVDTFHDQWAEHVGEGVPFQATCPEFSGSKN